MRDSSRMLLLSEYCKNLLTASQIALVELSGPFSVVNQSGISKCVMLARKNPGLFLFLFLFFFGFFLLVFLKHK